MSLVISPPLALEEWADRPVSEQDVLTLLESSIWAPNDGLREPWRFIYVDRKDATGALPGHSSAPAHLIVVAALSESSHKQVEDLCAVYGLIQNFRLLASEYQIYSRTTIAPWTNTADIRARFRLHQQEQIAAILDLGYSSSSSSHPTGQANIQLQIEAY